MICVQGLVTKRNFKRKKVKQDRGQSPRRRGQGGEGPTHTLKLKHSRSTEINGGFTGGARTAARAHRAVAPPLHRKGSYLMAPWQAAD